MSTEITEVPVQLSSTLSIGDWSPTVTIPNMYYYSYPTTIYYYQIICPKPRCKTANWLELDTLKECSKCGAMLKAVKAKADYEVEVG